MSAIDNLCDANVREEGFNDKKPIDRGTKEIPESTLILHGKTSRIQKFPKIEPPTFVPRLKRMVCPPRGSCSRSFFSILIFSGASTRGMMNETLPSLFLRSHLVSNCRAYFLGAYIRTYVRSAWGEIKERQRESRSAYIRSSAYIRRSAHIRREAFYSLSLYEIAYGAHIRTYVYARRKYGFLCAEVAAQKRILFKAVTSKNGTKVVRVDLTAFT